jgi:hypothetical protein
MSREMALIGYFFNRTDLVASLAPWSKPCPAIVRSETELTAAVNAHLSGSPATLAHRASGGHQDHPVRRIGTYIPGPDNRTRWLCIDFDGGGHKHALESPEAIARLALERARRAGLSAYLERSGGGRGWHLWMFFGAPILSENARAIGLALAPREAPLVSGEHADVERNRGIEVFPKTAFKPRPGESEESAAERNTGSMVWLPWWHGAPEGANRFDDDRTDFEPARIEDLRAYLAAQPKPERPAQPQRSEVGSPEWRRWRQDMAAALPLESIYRLSGRGGRGWLECFDPSYEDKSPSASVSDGTGGAARGLFYSHRTNKTYNPIDYVMEYHGIPVFLDACKYLADLSGVPLPGPRRAVDEPSQPAPNEDVPPPLDSDAPPPPEPTDERMPLCVKDDELLLVTKLWDALTGVHPRAQCLFRWGGEIVKVEDGQTRRVDSGLLRYESTKRVRWHRRIQQGKGWGEAAAAAPATVISAALARGDRRLGELRAIVTVPVFDRHGRIIRTPGYDQESGIYYAPDREIAEVPEKPTEEDVSKARDLILSQLIVDFPFARPSDRAHAVAALLSPFVRHMIRGATPLYLFEAPAAGSGKSKLAQCVETVFAGRSRTLVISEQDSETEKKLAAAITGQPGRVILLDNVNASLNSPVLAALMTCEIFESRVLGLSVMAEAPNLSTFLVTSNNPHVTGEILRRALVVRIDARVERPEFRPSEQFRHELPRWAQEERPQLVWSLLTMAQHWIASGARPGSGMGSFEHFAQVMGGILAANGIDGFLSDRSEILDPESEEIASLYSYWWQDLKSEDSTGATIMRLVNRHQIALSPLVGSRDDQGAVIRLGRMLEARRDQIVGGYVVRRSGSAHRRTWRLERAGQAAQLEIVRDSRT